MLEFILRDDSMPRTIFWDRFLDAARQSSACLHNSHDFLIPGEDIAIETNWPAYGSPATAYLRGATHEIGSGKNVNRYLGRVVEAARERSEKRFLLVNMHPFFRVPLFFREMKNIYIADCNLVEFERALNPRTISFPALPFSIGVPLTPGSRKILASFQGIASHPVRHALASIADGKRIIVNLVERSNHVGKINALTKSTDKTYEQLLENSVFAFVPRGDANFSYRLLEVMSFGCIPVILSDGWVLPFDRLLSWDKFSLRFSTDAIPLIPSILGSLSQNELYSRFEKVRTTYDTHLRDLGRIVDTLFAELNLL